MPPSWPISSTRGFRVHCYQTEDATVVECHGKLTVENAPLLRSEAKNVMDQKKRIVLDLKEVPMIDSSGLGAIAGLYVSARTRGHVFELVNANRQIRELFGISKLLTLFEAAGRHGGKMI
jgi:anti-sigma B factor antagonist